MGHAGMKKPNCWAWELSFTVSLNKHELNFPFDNHVCRFRWEKSRDLRILIKERRFLEHFL